MTQQQMTERDVALKTVAGFFAYGFGSGLAPFAPGTFGTLAAVPFAFALKLMPAAWFWSIRGSPTTVRWPKSNGLRPSISFPRSNP